MAEFTDAELAAGLDQFLAEAKAKGMSEADQAKTLTDALFQNNISLQRLADATRYGEGDIQNILNRVSDQGQPISVPGDLGLEVKTGLKGTESAIDQGLIQARNDIIDGTNRAQERIQTTTGQATAELDPFKQTGLSANQSLAAFQGLLGPEAQAEAYRNFQESPGQAYLVEQANRNILGNATATGGVGGGNVRRELQRQAIGLAAQDFGNQMNRLETTRGGGQAAAAGTAQLMSTGGLGEAEALTRAGMSLAELASGAGSQKAQARLSTSQLLGDQAFQTGMQQAGFNQQNKTLGVGAIGNAGADLATQIQNAARANGNVNLSTADIMNNLAALGIRTIPGLESDRSDILGAGQLAGANQAAATGTRIAQEMIAPGSSLANIVG